jgi:hypothetical protein
MQPKRDYDTLLNSNRGDSSEHSLLESREQAAYHSEDNSSSFQVPKLPIKNKMSKISNSRDAITIDQAYMRTGGFGKAQILALSLVVSGIMGVAFFSANLIFFELIPTNLICTSGEGREFSC